MGIDDLTDEQLQQLVERVDKSLWSLCSENRVDPLTLFPVILARFVWLGTQYDYLDDMMDILEHALSDYSEYPEDYSALKERVNPMGAQIIPFPGVSNDNNSDT
jgi:hypothetical protein